MSVLAKIFDTKREEVMRAMASVSAAEIERLAHLANAPRGFLKALRESPADVALIAEVKKASPSRGVIREDFHPGEIAGIYARAGACALSVLTDENYFQGSPQNLRAARAASGLPCLRKDFMMEPYQVYEARAWGADAILLIVAALEDAQIRELANLARSVGMDVLVEVHTDEEAERALALGEPLIGVNNRDLATFRTTLDTSARLLPRIAPHALAVSESGIETRADVDLVRDAGAQAVLIGTSFCAAPDIGAKVREVMGPTPLSPPR